MIKIKNLNIHDMDVYKATTLYEIFGTKLRRNSYIIFFISIISILFLSGFDETIGSFISLIVIAVFSFQFLMRFTTLSYKEAESLNRINFDLTIIDNFIIIKFTNDKELKNKDTIYYFKYPILDILEQDTCFVILLSRVGGNAFPMSNTFIMSPQNQTTLKEHSY